ncbi:MAG: hypothetical protein NC401_17755, partial [Ruminococcus sp.]|nr:hypothetical protein [Ruminococcus sp.]
TTASGGDTSTGDSSTASDNTSSDTSGTDSTSGGISSGTTSSDNASAPANPTTGVSFGFAAVAAVLAALGVTVTAVRRDN